LRSARQAGVAFRGLGQLVVALGQSRVCLLMVPDLTLAGLVLRLNLRKTFFGYKR
jgi:hypothetical protein